MGFNDDVRELLTEIRGQLERIEKLLSDVPTPCDGQRGGLVCSLAASHNGWHLAADGRTQWLDD